MAVHRSLAATWNGPLDRPEWWWAFSPGERFLYGWREDGRLTGFVRFEHARGERWGYRVVVHDIWAATGDAWRGLLGFLAGHAPQVPRVEFRNLGSVPGFYWHLPEQEVKSTGGLAWMLRLVDPAAALAGRGWPAHASGCIELEVTDPMADGPRLLTLEVAGGRASARYGAVGGGGGAGGGGRTRLGIGALAAWFAGGLSPRSAQTLGLIEAGSESDLDVMASLMDDRPVLLPDAF
jgi:predicted acetyltransferase